jgi:hypothetical protein
VAEAIIWFLGLDAESLGRLGKNAREKAERVFDVRKQSQALRRYYHDALAGFERPPQTTEPMLGAQGR